jgi:hypothetical protein
MNDETARWLLPMLREARDRGWGPEEMLPLMFQSLFPGAEADDPVIDWAVNATSERDDVQIMATDHIGFGRRLRDKLGWDGYPDISPCAPG